MQSCTIIACFAATGAILRGRQPTVGSAGNGNTGARQHHQDLLQLRQRRTAIFRTRHSGETLRRPPFAIRRAATRPDTAAILLRRHLGERRRADRKHPCSQSDVEVRPRKKHRQPDRIRTHLQ